MSKIETWVRSLANSKRYSAYVKKGKSVKKAVFTLHFADCILVTCGKASYCIGSDKLGHFFQQGFMLYEFKLEAIKDAAKLGIGAADASALGDEIAHALGEWFERIEPTDPDITKILKTTKCEFYDFPNAEISEYFGIWGGGTVMQQSQPDVRANDAGLKFYEGQAQRRPLGHTRFDICRYVRPGWREP